MEALTVYSSAHPCLLHVAHATPSAEFLAALLGSSSQLSHHAAILRLLTGWDRLDLSVLEAIVVTNFMPFTDLEDNETDLAGSTPLVLQFLCHRTGIREKQLLPLWSSSENKRKLLIGFILVVVVRFVQHKYPSHGVGNYDILKASKAKAAREALKLGEESGEELTSKEPASAKAKVTPPELKADGGVAQSVAIKSDATTYETKVAGITKAKNRAKTVPDEVIDWEARYKQMEALILKASSSDRKSSQSTKSKYKVVPKRGKAKKLTEGINTSSSFRESDDEDHSELDAYSANIYNDFVRPDTEGNTPLQSIRGDLDDPNDSDYEEDISDSESSDTDELEDEDSDEDRAARKRRRARRAAKRRGTETTKKASARRKDTTTVSRLPTGELTSYYPDALTGVQNIKKLLKGQDELNDLAPPLRWDIDRNPLLISEYDKLWNMHRGFTESEATSIATYLDQRKNNEYGIILIDVSGTLYNIKYKSSINSTDRGDVLNFVKLFNPDKDVLLASTLKQGPTMSLLFPRSKDEFDAFFEVQAGLASRPTRLRYKETPGVTLVDHINRYKTRLYEHIEYVIFPGEGKDWHNNTEQATRLSILLSFHLHQWIGAIIAGDLSLLVSTFKINWMPYNTSLEYIEHNLTSQAFSAQCSFLLYHCHHCGLIGVTGSTCTKSGCITINTKEDKKSTEYKKIPSEEYEAKYAVWVKKAKDKKVKGSTSRAVFTRETNWLSDGTDLPSSNGKKLTSLDQFLWLQNKLPYFAYDVKYGVSMQRLD